MSEYAPMQQVAAEIAAIDIERLCRKDQPLELNFEQHRLLFERVQRFFSLISKVRLDWIPTAGDGFRDQIESMNRIKQAIERITTTDLLKEDNPRQFRTSTVNQITSHLRQVFDAVFPRLTYALFADQTLVDARNQMEQQLVEKVAHIDDVREELLANINKTLSHYQAELKKALEEAQQTASASRVTAETAQGLLSQMEQTAENARKAAQVTGISAQSQHFQILAKEYADSASHSLLSAIIIGVFLLIMGWTLFTQAGAAGNSTDLIQKIIGRVLVVSVGLTAFVVALRNHGAAKHNYTVNRHKATTLQTFEVFINGSASPDVKEAILLQAAKSSFEPQSTGFLRTEGEGPQISQITELVKAAK
jgi:hypothetical protein